MVDLCQQCYSEKYFNYSYSNSTILIVIIATFQAPCSKDYLLRLSE